MALLVYSWHFSGVKYYLEWWCSEGACIYHILRFFTDVHLVYVSITLYLCVCLCVCVWVYVRGLWGGSDLSSLSIGSPGFCLREDRAWSPTLFLLFPCHSRMIFDTHIGSIIMPLPPFFFFVLSFSLTSQDSTVHRAHCVYLPLGISPSAHCFTSLVTDNLLVLLSVPLLAHCNLHSLALYGTS